MEFVVVYSGAYSSYIEYRTIVHVFLPQFFDYVRLNQNESFHSHVEHSN